jgi:23S rRNA pseudouridine1911/1915/1917 synthase
MSVRAPRGRPARSTWQVEEQLDGAALVRVQLHTGRTHQVRVHLASIGHPLVGDATYGGGREPSSRTAAAREAIRGFPRPALHAAVLAFDHPRTGERVRFEAPLPGDLQALRDRLRPS